MERLLRTAIAGSAGFFVGAGLTGAVWLHSAWFAALWALSAAVLGASYGAKRLATRHEHGAALRLLIGAHLLAAAPTVAILPEAAAPVALVLVGDVVIAAAFVQPRQLRGHIAAAMTATAAVGLLSLQSWTGLGQRLPHPLLVAALALHVLGTGAVASAGARSSHRGLIETSAALAAAGRRRRDVVAAQRARIEREITAGPAATLHALGDRLDSIVDSLNAGDEGRAAATAGALEAASQAQEALAALRDLSHGIFPESLSRQGLESALRSLARQSPALVASRVHGAPDPQAAAAIYFTVSEVTEAHTGAAGTRWEVRVDDDGRRCSFELAAHGDRRGLDEVPDHVVDRIGALDGELALHRKQNEWTLRGYVPVSDSEPNVTKAESAQHAPDDAPDIDGGALQRFVNVSLLMCSSGVAFLAVVFSATAIRSLGLLAVALCGAVALLALAWVALRAKRVALAVMLVCIETLGAGVVVSALLPSFLPVTLLISVMPMMLALPHLGQRATTRIAALQSAGGATVTALALNGGVKRLVDPVPATLEAVALATACAAITLLIALTASATNARLIERSATLRASLASIVADADAERQRIERDLHDGAQQHLVAIALQLRVVAVLAARDPDRARTLAVELGQLTETARSDLSALVAGIGQANIAERGLSEALRVALARLGRPASIHGAVPSLPEDVATTAYFCCLEAVQNVLKHAGPTAVIEIHVCADTEALRFEVRDDGVGFDTSVAPEGRGLRNIAMRCEAARGAVQIDSVPGTGTTLRGHLPLR